MRFYSLVRRSVSLLLAVLVLITSVGFTVQRQTCRMSGLSTVAVAVAGLADPHGRAGKPAPAAPVAKNNCCDFSKQLHKLSMPAHELAAKILLPGSLLLAMTSPSAPDWPTGRAAVFLAGRSTRWFTADSSPPPRGGRALLTFACTLVV